MDRIILKNMIFWGRHGLAEAERERGQQFAVDLEMMMDLKRAGETDSEMHTVDYRLVHALVKSIMDGRQFNLLEGLAERIAREILARFLVEEVVVRVSKPQVALEGMVEYAGVEIHRHK